jgi:F-type H+-transporting ATPase subunit a
MKEFHIPPLKPEALFDIAGISITNTIVNVWIVIIIFFIIGILIKRNLRTKPGKLQNFIEYILELVLPYFDQVTGDRKKTIKFLPIVGSIFFFILLSNWLGLMPGTGSLLWGHLPLLRPAATDLNLNLAMALVAVIGSHLFGFAAVGVFTHLGKFIQIKNLIKSIPKGPIAIFTAFIEFFVGLLEIISEIAKIISLSFRLLGNIFAGEVLLTVMAALFAFLLPTPFMFLELLVGLIQATVFSMLTLAYLEVATAKPHGEH